jgi:predicted kinase
MGKLTVLIGLARSGKSTFAENWQQNIPFDNEQPYEFFHKRVVVNSDSIRLAMHGHRYIRESEPFVHAMTKVMVKSLFSQGYNVLIDETNTTVGSIRQWLEIDPDAKFIYLDTSVRVCQERAMATGQNDLVNVIPNMYDNLLDLCNYTLNKKLCKGEEVYLSMFIDTVNEDDLMMSVEDIREEVKRSKQ